jgi:hypothetical protein
MSDQKDKESHNPISFIQEFFGTCKTYEQAMDFLKIHKSNKFFEYSLVISRKILFSLVVYQFGKEMNYPDVLYTKARQMILYFLQNKEDHPLERRRIVRNFIEEFDKFKKEDLKKYMYELGVEYAQLQDIKNHLGETEDDQIWKQQIEELQNKITEYVNQSNGYPDFQKCLDSLLSMKKEIIQQFMEQAYWDIVKEDLSHNKFDLLITNFLDIKQMLLEIHRDEDTIEIMDEKYFIQLLENQLFDDKALIGQIEFIYGKMKKYGIPIYDSLIDKTKKSLIEEVEKTGINSDIIVKTFQKTVPLLKFYLDVIRIYRKKIP